jgi:hypothetical protein
MNQRIQWNENYQQNPNFSERFSDQFVPVAQCSLSASSMLEGDR